MDPEKKIRELEERVKKAKDRYEAAREYQVASYKTFKATNRGDLPIDNWDHVVTEKSVSIGMSASAGDELFKAEKELSDFKNQVQEPQEEESAEPNDGIVDQELVAMALFDGKIKMVSLLPDGRYRLLDDAANFHKIFYTWSSETLALQRATEELEALINSHGAKEAAFQDFFECHPEFILNDEYRQAHPQIVLIDDRGESLIPDFILEPVDQHSICDLLELKLPSAPVFVLKKNRPRFSAAVLEACAQLHEYRRFFDEEKNRIAVRDKYGLLAYRPKMFVIIGRRGTVNPIEVRKIEGALPNLTLRTYDDVLQRMKAKIETMKKGQNR